MLALLTGKSLIKMTVYLYTELENVINGLSTVISTGYS